VSQCVLQHVAVCCSEFNVLQCATVCVAVCVAVLIVKTSSVFQ